MGTSTKDQASRYSALRKSLDTDLNTNGNWVEIDTTTVGDTRAFTFGDLFSGAGGISVGLSSAKLEKVFSVEIDKDASKTIKNNFPQSLHFESPIEEIPDEAFLDIKDKQKVNLVIGGPPCQGFSVAGLRNPHDPRNKLFQEFVRVVKCIHPEFVVLENVPGILTMEKGAVAREIRQQFSDIGYPDMSVRILEAAEYGVPQLRTRAIFIANRLGIKNPYPKPIFKRGNYKTIESAIDDLKDIPFNEATNHIGTRHSREFVERIKKVKPGESLYETYRDAFKRQQFGAPCMTIKENHGGVHIHYELDRVLTAREMARLQTFPDDYIFFGSHKRAYWQIGNAVPCTLAEHIGLAIKASLWDANI